MNGLTEDEELELLELEEEEYQASKAMKPSVQASQSGPTELESAGRGALQGTTFGFADELGGAVQGGMDAISGLFGESPSEKNKKLQDQGFIGDIGPTDSTEMYKRARDENRLLDKEAEMANPMAYTGGEIGGGIATAFVPGLGGTKIADLAAQGAAYGLGSSDAEDLGGMALDTAIGGGTGAVIGKATESIGNAISKGYENMSPKVAEYLKKIAEEQSARAQGLQQHTAFNAGDDIVRRVGRQGLDEGVVSLGANTSDMLARNEAVKKSAMGQRSSIYDAIDEAGLSSFNPQGVAKKLNDELSPKYRTKINKSEHGQLDNVLDSVLSRGKSNLKELDIDDMMKVMGETSPSGVIDLMPRDNISLKEAQGLAEEIREVAYPGGKRPLNPTPKQTMAADAYRIVRNEINKIGDAGADAINLPGLKGKLAESNSKYATAKESDKLLRKKLSREQGNNIFGLTDAIATGAGLGAGAGIGGDTNTSLGMGAALLGGKKLASAYGVKALSLGADRLADIVRKSPQSLGKYGPAFQKALQRGGNAMGVTDFLLQQNDPEYRELKKRLEGEEQ